MIHIGHLMYARNRTVRRASFFRKKLPPDVGHKILFQRYARVAALLRAIMHETVFAYVEVAGPGTAAPVVRLAFGDIVLKPVQARIVPLRHVLHLEEHFTFRRAQRSKLSVAVVDDADGRCEAELYGAASDHQSIMWIVNSAANHRINVDVEFGVLRQ